MLAHCEGMRPLTRRASLLLWVSLFNKLKDILLLLHLEQEEEKR